MVRKPTYEELEQRAGGLEKEVVKHERAEEALRESEEKLAGIIASVTDHMSMMDDKHNIVWANDVAKSLFGPDLIGKKCFSVYHGYEKPCESCVVRKCFEDGKVHDHVTVVTGRAGRKMTFWCTASVATRHTDGRPKTVVEISRDITRLERAEKAQKESEERLATIVNTALDSIFIKDNSYRYQFVNAAMERLFGVPASELLGKSDEELFGGDAAKHLREVDRRVLQGEIVEEENEKPVRGVLKTFHVVKVPMRDAARNITGLCGIARDITARKRMEVALRKAHDELERRVEERTAELTKLTKQLRRELTKRKRAEDVLRASEANYRAIFDSANDGIFVLDVEKGEILDANHKVYEMYGYSVEELRRVDIEDLMGGTPPYTRVEGLQYLRKAAEGEPQLLEWLAKDRAGRVFWVELNLKHAAIRGKDCVLGIVRDISERKRAEEERAKLEDQLRQAHKVEALGTLAGGIAHDFNNLLTGILGNTSLMLLDVDPSHPHYENLKIIEKQVRSGARLTRQLLGYARKGRYEVKPIDLNRLVEETSDTFGRTRKEIRIHRELAEDLWAVEADQGQMEQVLLNLYVNAADAMPRGGDLFLKTKNIAHEDIKDKFHSNPGNYVLLRVTDTGMGMDKKTMERIFDPFFTNKEMGRGTGLGLASVHGIIKGHGGYIDAESRKGQGTTFNIYLPASEKKSEKPVKTAEDLIRGSGTVLLVDDEEMVLEVNQKLLEAMGYRVLTAQSGREAIELYKEKRDDIDIVILDIVMPDMGGGETFDRMKDINPDIKVLLSSGYSVDGEASRILGRGCDGFIQKPFNMSELSGRIREILDKE